MATLVLAAAGSALGGAAGGSFAGLTSLALGKAVGATLGSAIDQRLLGAGSAPVETGRVDRFRVMGSSEGAALPRVFGRMRVSGQIIWSSRFLESVTSQRVGGKGGGGGQKVREFSYSVSLAIALCEGEVIRVGRIWADGQVVEQAGLTWRMHAGSEAQLPDPVIAAIEGLEQAPAYRGTAYVVIENLDLTPYGNRIPQFNFEVFRRPDVANVDVPRPPALDVRGVALVPGTGEYSLATEPIFFNRGKGDSVVINVNNDRGIPDLKASLDQLNAELPNARSVALVVSWFGDDLRCDRCALRPAVEQPAQDGAPMPWTVSGQSRGAARVVSKVEGRPVFGGTPADASVIQAIEHMTGMGQSVMFYPFILMDILAGNGLSDPWTGASDQPPVPWRGRITLSRAPGRTGSVDKTSAAAVEAAAFFGQAQAGDFEIDGRRVRYVGPPEWSYRRFILHYAHLCAVAGGVDAFCIGSELRGLTQIRDGAASYPVVRALSDLATDVRGILGADTRIGYAADWSEYFGHQPADGSGDVLFHLDPLWAHPAIDFIGIDNYMPLSDWRDGSDHADASAGSIYAIDYLKSNVAGGEGFDWYYADQAGRAGQDRLPITDGGYGEHWVFRYKDLVSWWSQPHVDRVGGIKAAIATAWQPRSKPIWFTELGCPAVDKGANQPNVFHDPKSSESFYPYNSSGTRDDFIQYRYLQATFAHWNDPAHNPRSDVYAGQMVDMARAHVWAWDARPWPEFPNRVETWVDGDNYATGHWLNGRASQASLAEVVAEVCSRADLDRIEVTALHGGLTGYVLDAVETARQSLQPLMLIYGFDSFERDGRVAFSNRNGRVVAELSASDCADTGKGAVLVLSRSPIAESAGRVTLGFVRSGTDYQAGAVEALAASDAEPTTAQTSVPVVLSEGEGQIVVERWLSESAIARDAAQFALPPSELAISPGDVVALRVGDQRDLYRIDRIDEMGYRGVSAVRIEPAIYAAPVFRDRSVGGVALRAPTPVFAEFLDLPMLTGEENPQAGYVAVAKYPWSGSVAVYSASDDFGYVLNREVLRPAVLGETLTPLAAGIAGRWMPALLRVRILAGALQSRSPVDVLNGANAAALRFGGRGDWEVIQFETAELVGPSEYLLSGLLRGQAGTDAVIPENWPAGTDFVLLDGAVTELDVPDAARGFARHYRVGPALRPYDDASYIHEVRAFGAIGLRPYRPTHFQAARRPDGAIALTWIRRTRIDGDSWEGPDVPLGEEREAYHLRALAGPDLLREWSVSTPAQVYSLAQQVVDDAPASIGFEVAQVSERFGAGPYERTSLNG